MIFRLITPCAAKKWLFSIITHLEEKHKSINIFYLAIDQKPQTVKAQKHRSSL